jgi:uncharacterized membrane protein YfcA
MLGAGSGNVIVPVLEKYYDMEEKNSHATSVFIVFFVCISSTFLYLINGQFDMFDALPYIIYGIPGAVLGTIILSHINQKILRKIFSIFIIFAGARMLFK